MIATYLDLTAAHISQETMEILQRLSQPDEFDSSWPALTIAGYREGAFISVPGVAAQQQLDALPEDLCRVLDYAKRMGVSLVRFDADGHATHNLPIYDW